MRSSRSGVLLASVLLVLLPAAAPAAQAKKPPAAPWKVSDIRVTPKQPQVTGEVTVSFTAGKLRPDQRYDVWLQAQGPTTDFCNAGYSVRIKGRKRPGSRVTVIFTPGDSRAWDGFAVRPGLGRFCAGDATVWIGRADAGNTLKLAGTRSVTLVPDRDYPKAAGVPVKISVLDGSALSVKATGRDDRSMPVTGELRGIIPGEFRPNTDVAVGSLTGSLRLASLRIDPLCAGTGPFTTDLAVVPGGPSNLILKASGEGTLTLALAADRLSLAGCAAPATPVPTTLVLTGKVNADGLLKFPISGSVTGVPIADGVTADVTAGLVLNVDLSGKG